MANRRFEPEKNTLDVTFTSEGVVGSYRGEAALRLTVPNTMFWKKLVRARFDNEMTSRLTSFRFFLEHPRVKSSTEPLRDTLGATENAHYMLWVRSWTTLIRSSFLQF